MGRAASCGAHCTIYVSRVTRIRVDARPGAEVKTLAGDGEVRAGDEDVDRLMEALPTGPT